MFTGIVEEVGAIKNVKHGQHSAVLTIQAKTVLEETRIGDSIAVNGICLTVTRLFPDGFSADVMHETLNRSSLAGLAAGLIYKLASKVNGYFGVFCSAIVAPIVNTGVFLLGCKLFFMDTITSWAEAAGSPNVGSYIILSFVGINFLIELGVNMVCSPIILRLINIRKKEG